MKTPSWEWVKHMAELEDGLPISAGGLPFRELAPPCTDMEMAKLQAMAELEDGLPVSAGGLPFRQLERTDENLPATDNTENARQPEVIPERTRA
jgi:hypothetical protein